MTLLSPVPPIGSSPPDRAPVRRRVLGTLGLLPLALGPVLAAPAAAEVTPPAVLAAAPIGAAVLPGQDPSLPEEVTVELDGGGTGEAEVVWDTADLSFDRLYSTVPVPGTVDGSVPVTAYVEVVPETLRYYVDAGAQEGVSGLHAAVAESESVDLLNAEPDRAAAAGGWGYLAAGLDGTRTGSPYQSFDKRSHGHYGFNNSTEPLSYTFTDLDPGTYTVTVGVDEWWSGPRTVSARISGAGLADDTALGEQVVVSSGARTATISGTVTTTQAGSLDLDLVRTGGSEAPVVSWIAVAEGDLDVDTAPVTLAAPTAVPGAGIYAVGQQVTLSSATPGAVIYYTLDGSAPSRTNGLRYTDPVEVSESATVRAVAVRNGIAGPELSASYVIEPVPDGGYTQVPVGRTWYDTDGDSIQAHGGGFLQHEGWYYWVGENKSHNSARLYAVSLYRSQDLLNWEHVNDIVTTETPGVCETGTYTGPECKIERPKLLYNEATDTFVMWGHWETADSYAASHLIVATSDTIGGDYEVVRNYRPGVGAVSTEHEDPTYPGEDDLWGYGSRDFTVFQDPDSDQAYLFSTQDHEDMRVYPLTADYTDVVVEDSYPLFVGGHREAPAVVKIDGTYYVMGSGQSGWYPNQTRVGSSTDLSDPDSWSDLSLVGNNSSFYSQPTNIITVEGTSGERSYIYMGDRWNSKQLGSSTYVWLPLTVQDGELSLEFHPEWSFDPATAAISTPAVDLVSEGMPAQASTETTPAGRANDGVVVNENQSGDSSNYWAPSAVPATWQVDLGEPLDLARIDLAWRAWNGSETRSTYTVSGSLDGETWEEIAQREDNRMVAFTTDPLAGTYQHVRVDISSVINDHNGNPAHWAAGLVEVQVYAEEEAVEPPVASFSDVPEETMFFAEIEWLASQGISTGWEMPDGSSEFRPLSPINRDAMAAFLYRMAGEPEVTLPETSPFVDVSASNQFYTEIVWLAQEGISTGWSTARGAEFRPLAPIARDAMAAFLYRYDAAENGVQGYEPPAVSPFADVAESNQFYTEISWMAEQEIATGWDGSGNDGRNLFRPLNNVARDAMAAFLFRYAHQG